jgi:NAD(P)-dependent dehydrogenase (short-subunit alcohol dehydrogenase family)
VFLITGGSRGIGAATAVLAAQHGHPVAFFYRERADEAATVVAAIEATGSRAIAIKADIADEAAVRRGFAAVDAFGPLGVLVNNAGIIGGRSRFEDVTTDSFEKVLRVNVMGTFFATREAVRRLSTRHGGKGGSIINVSSGTAISGGPGTYVHYAATKGAMDTMTAGLSKELGPEGIRVNTVRPGAVLTDMQRDRPAEQLERIGKGVPLGRLGTPQDIAETIVWLASPAAAYVNGAFIDVRGG